MKGIIFLIVVCVIFGILFAPHVMKEKQCYDIAAAGVNDLNYYTAAKAWDAKEVCRRRTVILTDLEDCVAQATGSGTLMRYGNGVVASMVSMVRPMSKGISTLKEDHNSECSEYTTYQLE